MTAATIDLETLDAVDLCAGPGGWDVAAERLGLNVLGFEIDDAALQTRDAAGHATATAPCDDACVRSYAKPSDKSHKVTRDRHDKAHPRGVRGLSMTEVDPRDYYVSSTYASSASHGRGRGGIGSPPCQGFSTAGKGEARKDSIRLLAELEGVRTLRDLEGVIASAREWMSHEGTVLVLEPLRWALSTSPSWLAWEQVPAVLPLWEACAVILRRLGYSVATGILTTEMFGVPQTRRRAILVARAPWLVARLGPVSLPTPTHSRYHNRTPDRLDPGVPRWVSMAEALGFGATARPSMTVTGGGSETGGAEPFGNAAREGLHREVDAGRWIQRSNYSAGGEGTAQERGLASRELDAPSSTLTSKGFRWEREGVEVDGMVREVGASRLDDDGAKPLRPADTPAWTVTGGGEGGGGVRHRWQPAPDAVNNQSGTAYDVDEQIDTPATALATRDLVGFRGPNANRHNGSSKSRNDGIRVSVEEAATLQTFPARYPFQGNKGKAFQQVGNAVPPLFAEAILCAVLDLPFRPALRGDA